MQKLLINNADSMV